MQNLHITRSSERADLVLKQAMELLEKHRDTVGPDSYRMGRGWLTRARDYRSGLEDKNVVAHYQQSQTYLKEAQEALRNIEQLTLGLYHQ